MIRKGTVCHYRTATAGITLNLIIAVLSIIIDSSFTYGYNESNVKEPNMKVVLTSWLEGDIPTNFTKVMDGLSGKRDQSIQTFNIERGFFGDHLRLLDGILRLGTVVGSLWTLKVIRHFGRKGSLLLSSFLNIFSVLFSGYAKYFEGAILLFIGRFLFGIKCGLSMVIAPIYILEIVPVKVKPQFSVIVDLCSDLGNIFGSLMGSQLGSKDYWPLVLSLSIFMTIIQLTVLPLCPESPKHLYVIKGNEHECKRALRWLRGDIIDEELFSLKKELCQRRLSTNIRMKTLFENKILRHALSVSVMLIVSYRLCRTQNFLVNYFGFAERFYFHCLFITSKLFAVVIVNKFQRRTLLFTTFILMAFTCLVLCFLSALEMSRMNKDLEESAILSTLIMVVLVLHITFYTIGIGSLAWLMPAELFNTVFIHYAYVMGTTLSWLLEFIILIFYEPLQYYMGYLSFINAFIVNIMYAYYTYTDIPETRQKTVKEIYLSIYEDFKKKGSLE